MSENLTACACQSGKPYGECCEPFHSHKALPTTAEQLMRSRYCAFTRLLIDYILDTTVPNQQPLLNRQDLQEWAESTDWIGLEIVQHNPLTRQHSEVEFKAFFLEESKKQTHHERSIFIKIDSRWYFVDPTVPLPNKKQACVCGSEKKFKHCCGAFL